MPGYQLKHERISIAGVDDLCIRSLLDRQQFADPRGDAQALGISSAAWPLFGLLWPSGRQLAMRLALRPVAAGERILEIGCGLALASLVGHRRGADITASDCHPLAAAFLEENLRLNRLPPMPYRHGCWSADDPQLAPTRAAPDGQQFLADRYDLVIGSDLLYERDDGATMARFIDAHAQPAAQVWIVDPNRGNRSAFSRQMAARGYGLREERLDQPADARNPAYRGRLLVYRRAPP